MAFVDGKLCIDNILSNSDHVIETGVLDWNFSDHRLIVVRRKKAALPKAKVEFKGRCYKNYIKGDLQESLVMVNWDQFYATGNPQHGWDIIVNKIKSYLDRVCLQKQFSVREFREPWVTNELIEEIKDKDRALQVAKRSGLEEDWVRAKAARNRVGRLIVQAKSDFLIDQQEQLEEDPNKFWRLIKSIVPGKRVGYGKIALTTKDDSGNEMEIDGGKFY